MSNPIEIDMVTQQTQATDLNLLSELDDDPTRMPEGQTRSENARGDVSPSPDSFQVLPRTTPAGNENPRGLTETQMIQDRELLSIMEDISETTARSPGRSMSVVAETRVGADVVGLANFGRRNVSDSAGRSAGAENRTAVGHGLHDGTVGDDTRTAVGRNAPGRNLSDENRTAVGREMYGRSETAGIDTGLGTRTAVGHEVPVPADDGWSEEESKRLIENSRDNARIPLPGRSETGRLHRCSRATES